MKSSKSNICTALLLLIFAVMLTACGGGGSNSSTTTTAAKPAIANLAVATDSQGQAVTISWDTPTSNPPTYNIYWSTSPGVTKKNGNPLPNKTSPYTHTGLMTGKTYYYVVTQVVNGVESAESSQIMATPQLAVPAAPDGLVIKASDGSVTLSFDTTASIPTSTSSYTYNIYYDTDPKVAKSSTSATLKKITGASLASTAGAAISQLLDDGTPYYFVVTVVINGVESGESKTLSAIPAKVVSPVASTDGTVTAGKFGSPTSLTVDTGSKGQAVVKFDAATTPTGVGIGTSYNSNPVYTVYCSTNSTFPTSSTTKVLLIPTGTNNATPAATTTNLSGLAEGTPYYFKVTSSVLKTSDLTISNEVDSPIIVAAIPDTKTPSVPSGVAASKGDQQVSLMWTKDASGINTSIVSSVNYNIYYTTDATKATSSATLVSNATTDKTKIANISTNSYVHSGLTKGTTYYYVITAVGEGESAPSSIVSVTI